MQMNYQPAGAADGAGKIEVSPVTLYTKQSSAHKRCFNQKVITAAWRSPNGGRNSKTGWEL